jgi:hypothetical protein
LKIISSSAFADISGGDCYELLNDVPIRFNDPLTDPTAAAARANSQHSRTTPSFARELLSKLRKKLQILTMSFFGISGRSLVQLIAKGCGTARASIVTRDNEIYRKLPDQMAGQHVSG